jgi:uncharacterized protein (DUF2141 family)
MGDRFSVRVALPGAALAVAALVLAAATIPAKTAGAGSTGPLTVRLVGLRSARGQAGCLLYGAEKGFPSDPREALQRFWCPIAGSESACAFSAVAAGTYAVACFHDENGNGRMDRGLFGIPAEGWVVSNNAKGFLGPPSFAAAKFAFHGEPQTMVLRVSY